MDGENLKLKWFDISNWGIEGKGWNDTEKYYDRLPARAKSLVPENVWNLSHSPIGFCSHFKTDSTRIHARWTLENDQLGEDNFNICGFSGVDLYALNGDTWRWASAPPHFTIKDKNPDCRIIEGLSKLERSYRLYLPLRNPVLKVEVGVEEDASFETVAPRRGGELVYYGTSIVHGAFAVRSGLGHPQILGRRLGLPLINLGFSGNARMEHDVAKLIAELDASVFVIDALPNMDEGQVRERAETFIRTICEAHPKTPVVLVEDHPNMISWLKPEEMERHRGKWRQFSKVYRKLLKAGFKNISYVKGAKLFGTDNEASMDGVHPNDVGYMRMADILEKAIRKAQQATA